MNKIINRVKNLSGVTLAELLISVALIGLVLLTVTSLDIAARRFFQDAEEGVAALNDMSVAMEYMIRELERAIGDFDSPAFDDQAVTCTPPIGFRLRIDTDENGMANEDYSVEFCYSGNQITYDDGSVTQVIANRITGFDIERRPAVGAVREVVITLNAQDEPGSGPNITIQSGAYLRASAIQ
ncbi:MAG: hypothetical protein ABH954_04880 [Candidatus Omnitrophota bacterium]